MQGAVAALFIMAGGRMVNEFEMIERYFLPLTRGHISAGGLKDDAAVLDIPAGYELVVTSDTLNEAVHFMAGETPANIARKALRVNLSDLAAMGAKPLSYQLNIAFPDKPSEVWLAEFSNSLQSDNEQFNIFCSGGDTTSIKGDFLSLSITALGLVPTGCAVRRGGAKLGDLIVITGAIGDSYLGLKSLQDGLNYKGAVERYRVPQPRIFAADIIREHANAAADISDGLLADIMHIANASGVGAEIDLDNLVFSNDVRHALNRGITKIEDVITGGDDYELILAVSPTNLPILICELENIKLNPMVIGVFTREISKQPALQSKTHRIDVKSLGWQHF